MTDTRKELIYDIVIRGLPLTKSILLKAGLTESDINELLENEVLKQSAPNEYQLYTLYELYCYGLSLISTKDIQKANACFKRCHQLDPNNRIFMLQLFLKSLKLRDYKKAMEIFSEIEKIESEKYVPDNNLYLYLLNMITTCGKQYEERLYNMDYDSVLLPTDNNQNHNKEMNDIRHLIMKYKYRMALKQINQTIIKQGYTRTEQEVLKELIEQVIEKEKEFKLSILEYAREKKYNTIYSLLREVSKKRYLSNTDTYIFLISKVIIDILHTGIIPQITITDTHCIYEAIKGNNFELVKKINDEKMKKPPLDNQIIYVLLNDLNGLISKIQKEQTAQNSQNISHQDYIKEIEEKVYYLQQENISLEETIKQMKLTNEDILMIKLIYARDYYTEEMYLLGDILLQEVEKSKEKTTRVVKLLNEVRTNKNFYKNRLNPHTRKLSQY